MVYFVHVYNQVGKAVEQRELISLLAMRRAFMQVNYQRYVQHALQYVPTHPEELEFLRTELLDMYLQEEKVAVVWLQQLQHSEYKLFEPIEERHSVISQLQSYQQHCQIVARQLTQPFHSSSIFTPESCLPSIPPSRVPFRIPHKFRSQTNPTYKSNSVGNENCFTGNWPRGISHNPAVTLVKTQSD